MLKEKLILKKANQIIFWGAYYVILCICQGNHFYPLGYHNDLGKIFKNKT
jgi:hypothetical protein